MHKKWQLSTFNDRNCATTGLRNHATTKQNLGKLVNKIAKSITKSYYFRISFWTIGYVLFDNIVQNYTWKFYFVPYSGNFHLLICPENCLPQGNMGAADFMPGFMGSGESISNSEKCANSKGHLREWSGTRKDKVFRAQLTKPENEKTRFVVTNFKKTHYLRNAPRKIVYWRFTYSKRELHFTWLQKLQIPDTHGLYVNYFLIFIFSRSHQPKSTPIAIRKQT